MPKAEGRRKHGKKNESMEDNELSYQVEGFSLVQWPFQGTATMKRKVGTKKDAPAVLITLLRYQR